MARKPYQFLMIPVLREYIALEFAPERPLPFAYDLERVVDDFGAPIVGHRTCVATLSYIGHYLVIDATHCQQAHASTMASSADF